MVEMPINDMERDTRRPENSQDHLHQRAFHTESMDKSILDRGAQSTNVEGNIA
jgi:hypothetical protein